MLAFQPVQPINRSSRFRLVQGRKQRFSRTVLLPLGWRFYVHPSEEKFYTEAEPESSDSDAPKLTVPARALEPGNDPF